jgi:thiol-disulfide isomerase/thioredoxin
MLKRLALLTILALLPVYRAGAGEVMYQSPAEVVGKAFPALKVEFFGEKPITEGKARIVEFWATWCPPCRDSIPHLNEVYKKFKDKGLVVVGITDEDKQKVEAFRTKIPMDYNVATDTAGALLKQLAINGIPQAFVINKKGLVVWQGHPMELKEATLDQVLAE